MKRSITSLLSAATTFLGLCAISAMGQTITPVVINPPSSIAKPGDAGLRAHTALQILGPPVQAIANGGPPFSGTLYQTPASLACIYELQPQTAGCNPNTVTANPTGGSKAIAVVDAYDDSNAANDLQSFSTQFGLTPITLSSFQVVYAPTGGSSPGTCVGSATQPPSAAPYGWDVEESLDIEYAHAMAPQATLYLVEAQSNAYSDLLCAVAVANRLVAAAGGGEISMSWGSGEFSSETSDDFIFTKPNVVYFASTGDSPGTEYPSVSQHVVAVGGTSLSMNQSTGVFIGENTWQEGGGGISLYEAKPSYQNGVGGINGSGRHVPDISADANPYTGVWVTDTLVYGPGTWYVVGGTSVASPVMAGIVNAAGSFKAGTFPELETMYAGSGFFDVTVGDCGNFMGYFARTGWDFCTGIGAPRTYSGK